MSPPRLQCASPQLRIEEIIARKTIVDGEHDTALQFFGEVVDPAECRQTDLNLETLRETWQINYKLFQFWVSYRLMNQDEGSAVQCDKFFLPSRFGRDKQMDRHRIEQLVREMNADKRFELIEGFSPLQAIAELPQHLRL